MIMLPKQNNYEIALSRGWEVVAARAAAELEALGAARLEGEVPRWALPALDDVFHLDFVKRTVATAAGGAVGTMWQILALHYLGARVPVPAARRLIAFEEIPSARGYSAPYAARVLRQFCATAGKSREKLETAAEVVKARVVPGGDLALELRVFPEVPLTVVWYAGDEELGPGATFLFQDNLAALLEVEDIVVMAERVVGRLRGKPW